MSLARALSKTRSLTCVVCSLSRFRICQDRRRLLMCVALYTPPHSSMADCVAFAWDLLEDSNSPVLLKQTCLQFTCTSELFMPSLFLCLCCCSGPSNVLQDRMLALGAVNSQKSLCSSISLYDLWETVTSFHNKGLCKPNDCSDWGWCLITNKISPV